MRIETQQEMQIPSGQTSRVERPGNPVAIDEVLTERTGRIGETVLPAKNIETIDDIKTEAIFLSGAVVEPVDPVTDHQNELYRILEKRVTRLGLAMGKEAEKRSGFNRDDFDKEINTPSEEYRVAKMIAQDAVEAYKDASHAYIRAKHQSDGSDAALAELNRLNQVKERLEEQGYEAHLEVERLKKEDEYRVAMVRMEAKRKLAWAYSSVVADIRPVGGVIPSHDYTNKEALNLLNSTVGKHYPSEWIKASNLEGEMAVAATSEARAKYAAHQFYPQKPETGLEVQASFAGLVPDEKARDFLQKISDDGIEVHGYGTSFDNGDGAYRVVEFAAREEFNPETDPVNEDGTPAGEGWHYGFVPRTAPGGLHVPEEKVWYRVPVNYGKVVPTLFLAPNEAGHEKQTATAYHEFSHRAEDTVRGGVIEHLEEAFLVRRTTDENGVREELTAMRPGDGTLGGTELGRRGTFMMHYIGKEYLNHRSREVLAIGSESLFAGSYGSFLGLDGVHPVDLDHRGFTLGIFAVA